MKKISIIVPVYHAHSTLYKALASVVMQSISNLCQVVIINDGDSEDYMYCLNPFANFLDILYIPLNENVGVGAARQIGIDNSQSEYIVFLDADDEFYHPYSLELLLTAIESNPGNPLAIGNFVEIVRNPGLQIIKHKEDFVWLFSKIYSRSFLEEYGIKFTKTKANEDAGFNGKIEMIMAEKNLNVITIDDILYSWNYNPNSITRTNDYEYAYNQSVSGYTENMIDTIDFILNIFPNSAKIPLKIIEVMVNLYVMWVRSVELKPEYEEHILKYCYLFYHSYFFPLRKETSEKAIKLQLTQQLKNKHSMIDNIIPNYTIYQFLDLLEKQ